MGAIFLLKMERFGRDMSSCFMKVIGPILISLALGLISKVSYDMIFSVAPLYCERLSVFWCMNGLIGSWILFNILFNYFYCVKTNPGNPIDNENNDNNLLEAAERGENNVELKTCKFCEKIKPQRAHHCSICKKCVLKMDHHCPWMGQCVGLHNYKGQLPLLQRVGASQTILYQQNFESIFFVFVLSFAISASAGGLLAFHVYLILSAQTTIEFYGNRREVGEARARGEIWVNKYDLGRSKNFRAIFGKGRYWFSWLLPNRNITTSQSCYN